MRNETSESKMKKKIEYVFFCCSYIFENILSLHEYAIERAGKGFFIRLFPSASILYYSVCIMLLHIERHWSFSFLSWWLNNRFLLLVYCSQNFDAKIIAKCPCRYLCEYNCEIYTEKWCFVSVSSLTNSVEILLLSTSEVELCH